MNSSAEDPSGDVPSASELKAQSKKGLRAFFRQPSIKKLVSVLVPSALAAALFPIFGPAVAGTAAAIAIQNGLKLLGISFSAGTIEKLLKPLEGKKLEEGDVQAVLEETLEKLLPEDKQVNEEAAKALVMVIPEVKESALENPKLDTQWLQESLASNLEDQGWMMAKVAPQLGELIKLDLAQLEVARQRLLADWAIISQEVTATGSSEVTGVTQKAKGKGGQIGQRVAASDSGKISDVNQDVELT